jgi:hypothetical protein
VRIAVVLGAGATLAQARHLHESGVMGELPPLDATFFDRLVDLKLKATPALRAYAVDVLGVNPFLHDTPKPRMEEFFKHAFYDFISETTKEGPQARLYGQLVAMYRSLLLRTTNWIGARADEGPVPELIAAAAGAANQVDILTFNYDLVVENALAELHEARGRWCLRHGYGHFGAKRHFTFQRDADTFADPQTCPHPRPIRLYKLHGSLNWYVDTESTIPDAAVLRGERESGQRIRVTRRRQVPRRLRHGGQSSWPVLIPPVYAKQPFIRNFMAPIWEDARRALGACDRLVFYSYSIPLLDIEAEKEFQRAIAHNPRLAYVDVVNPDPGSASRYATALARVSVHWHADLARYLAVSPFG